MSKVKDVKIVEYRNSREVRKVLIKAQDTTKSIRFCDEGIRVSVVSKLQANVIEENNKGVLSPSDTEINNWFETPLVKYAGLHELKCQLNTLVPCIAQNFSSDIGLYALYHRTQDMITLYMQSSFNSLGNNTQLIQHPKVHDINTAIELNSTILDCNMMSDNYASECDSTPRITLYYTLIWTNPRRSNSGGVVDRVTITLVNNHVYVAENSSHLPVGYFNPGVRVDDTKSIINTINKVRRK